ncbi:metal-dependent hydrolase, partial [Nocardia gipuzkoensis]
AAEHYTATLAERLLSDPELRAIPADPEVRHLLDWHAMEELEHKSVTFDVYRAVGGTERTRIAVMAVAYVLTIPVAALAVLVSILSDRTGWHPITVTRQTIDVFRGPLLRGLMRDLRVYMKPGFHPDQVDTTALLARWQRELFGTQGELIDRVK